MEKKNPIGICEWTLPVSGPWVCKFVADIGYDGIQIDVGPWEKRFPLSRKVTQQAFLEEADRHGVGIASIATRALDWFSMFAPEGSEEQEIALAAVRTGIEAAAAMSVPIVMVPNFVASEAKTPEQAALLAKHLKWACDLASEHGVLVAEENVFSVDATIRLFESVDRENLRLYFDLQNYYLHHRVRIPEIVEPLLPYVVQVHAKDGKNDDLSGAPLGTGDVDLTSSFDELKRLGYRGWIVNENYYDVPPLVGPEDDPVQKISDDLATLRAAFG